MASWLDTFEYYAERLVEARRGRKAMANLHQTYLKRRDRFMIWQISGGSVALTALLIAMVLLADPNNCPASLYVATAGTALLLATLISSWAFFRYRERFSRREDVAKLLAQSCQHGWDNVAVINLFLNEPFTLGQRAHLLDYWTENGRKIRGVCEGHCYLTVSLDNLTDLFIPETFDETLRLRTLRDDPRLADIDQTCVDWASIATDDNESVHRQRLHGLIQRLALIMSVNSVESNCLVVLPRKSIAVRMRPTQKGYVELERSGELGV